MIAGVVLFNIPASSLSAGGLLLPRIPPHITWQCLGIRWLGTPSSHSKRCGSQVSLLLFCRPVMSTARACNHCQDPRSEAENTDIIQLRRVCTFLDSTAR